MLQPIWTRDALRSELAPFQGKGWRLVEAQHAVSTLKLVDSLDEQAVLEQILEDTKPPVPPECQHLHYLLYTPFRYRPYPYGSRFRRAGFTPGVWYGAQKVETAVAEMVFYRFLFFAESPDTPFPDNAAEYSAFCVPLATEAALDLTNGRLARDSARWTRVDDYSACQDLADTAREAGCELVCYSSVRDPDRGANLAVLACSAFAAKAPAEMQTWRVRMGQHGGQALREFPVARLSFAPDAFSADRRLDAMRWDR